ncbi:motile sperm domain-containing protein 2-like, partial [Tropilaelaps mercedesae]
MVQLLEPDPFEEKGMSVTKLDVEEFREKLLPEIEREKIKLVHYCAELYHPKDVEMIKANYEICRRYVRHRRRDIGAAVEMAKKSLQWRNEFGVNALGIDAKLSDISEANIYQLYLNVGCFIPFKKDKLGSQCIIFRTKLHRKNPDRALDMKRYLVFWVEKFLYEKNCPRMTFVFDSTDATYSSMDLEQVTFIIELFSSYYPWALGHVIVYNMPWMFKTVWSGIQALIPSEGADRFKFCDGKDIYNWIDPECLPDFMGGTETLPFRELSLEDIEAVLVDPEIEKRICSTPTITKFYRDNFGLFIPTHLAKGDKAMSIFSCRPDDYLPFKASGGVQTASFELTNCSPDGRPLVFKVKVNCLQGYSVKPFCGFLEKGTSVTITVNKELAHPVTTQDKLLIQSASVDQPLTGAQLSEYWQHVKPENLYQRKLRCCLADEMKGIDHVISPNKAVFAAGVKGRDPTGSLEKQVAELSARYRIQQIFNSVMCCLLILNFAITFHSKMCYGKDSRARWYYRVAVQQDNLALAIQIERVQ